MTNEKTRTIIRKFRVNAEEEKQIADLMDAYERDFSGLMRFLVRRFWERLRNPSEVPRG